MTGPSTHAGRAARAAFFAIVGLRLEDRPGLAPGAATGWQDEMARLQRGWDLKGGMLKADDLAFAVNRLFGRVAALTLPEERARALDDYASGKDDA